ncbi:MAG: phosphoribosyltransferase [Cyanobacteria bacterium J06639_1]
MRRFHNRREAGRLLATEIARYAKCPTAIVLGLPRGGVTVAYEIAKALDLPLGICLVRKLGVPWHPELAMGAIAANGVMVLNSDVITSLGIAKADIDAVAAAERQELARRERAYRGDRPAPDLAGKTVIVVDDGIATGSSLRAALTVLRQQSPARIVVAVPMMPGETHALLHHETDELVCLLQPVPFFAIGAWYEHFEQVSDAEVKTLLQRANPSELRSGLHSFRESLQLANQPSDSVLPLRN